MYFAHQPTSLPYLQTYTQTILQTHLHPTYLPDPYIPTLHTSIPTKPNKPANPYIPALSLHTYTTPTTTTPYSAYRPYDYTPAPRAGSHMVRLRSAREGILCAANFIGQIIAFEFDWFIESLLRKEGVLNSQKNLHFWHIAHPLRLGVKPRKMPRRALQPRKNPNSNSKLPSTHYFFESILALYKFFVKGAHSMGLFHITSNHSINPRTHPTPHALAKYTKEPWLYPPPSCTKERSSVRRA